LLIDCEEDRTLRAVIVGMLGRWNGEAVRTSAEAQASPSFARGFGVGRSRRLLGLSPYIEQRGFRLDWTGMTTLTTERGQGGIMSDDHTHSPEPESSSLAGYAAIKYTAIVIIVLAILAFLAWYIVPAFD
jgi:hypothetical protein